MGASQTKNAVDVVNEAIITCVIRNVSNCSTHLAQTQTVRFSGTGWFNRVEQSATLNVSCLQQIKMTNELSTQMAQQIQQDAAAQAIALMPSYSGSQNQTRLKNHIETHVSTSTIQECAVGAIQNQTVIFEGFQFGNEAIQTLDIFSKCMQEALNMNQVSQSIVQDVTQKAESTIENPFSFLADMWMYIVLGFIGFIVLLVVLAKFFFSGQSSQTGIPEQWIPGEEVYLPE